MNLLEIRKQFVNLSGREDLKNSDNTDNGADYFINAGSRWLDEQLNTEKMTARNYRLVESDEYVVPIKECRVVQEVWVTELVNSSWIKLKRENLKFFKERVSDLTTKSNRGTPLHYIPTNLRTSPATDRDYNLDFFNSIGHFSDYLAEPHYPYQGILLWPIPSRRVQVEIIGMFYQDKLVEDEDTNYWASVHPNLLVEAALRELESSYRNTQGVKDWENVIVVKLTSIDKDSVTEENVDIFEIGG